MVGMLELDWEFKMTVINMLMALMGKLDNSQKQMCNVNRDGNSNKETNKQKDMVEIKSIVSEMNNDFDGHW